MSWLSDLAGKAENLLNQIDQNAANVLKNENDQLLEQTTINDGINTEISKPSNTQSLLRTPDKAPQTISKEQDAIETIDDTNNATTSEHIEVQSGASNSSRRSSWSSRTEGLTVIEYPNTIPRVNSSIRPATADDERTELAAVKIVMSQLKTERDQMKAELEDVTRKAAMDNTKEICSNYESRLSELTAEKEQLRERLEHAMENINSYVKSISDLETTVTKLHQLEADMNEKLTMMKTEREHAIVELQQYRSRAQSTLLMKDQMIEDLRNLGSGNSQPFTEPSVLASPDHDSELSLLRSECDRLQREMHAIKEELIVCKQYGCTMESRAQDLEQRMNEREQFLNNAVQQEKIKLIQAEDTLQLREKELQAIRDESIRQQTKFAVQLNENQSEMDKLRKRITQWNNAGTSSKGFDDRINSLTQSLVQKQNALETITADRNAIKIQFEKLEQQYRSVSMAKREHNPTRIINVNDTDDDKSQVPNYFMLENPFDTRVVRRVKRAYSTLDSAGIRVGLFLRRPLIRVFFIIYVAILHLWVMLVLLSSTPT